MHQLLQQLERNVEALLRVGQREEHRIVGALAVDDAAQSVHPFVELLAALFRRNRGIVGNIVGVAHEGIHRRQRIALAKRQDQEAVVEVLGSRAGDVPANTVSRPQLQRVLAHNIFPTAARATSHSLRGLEIAGRLFSTS